MNLALSLSPQLDGTLTCFELTIKLGNLFLATFHPLQRPQTGCAAGGKTSSDQIAAGGSFPIEHLTGAEYARQRAQHHAFIERLEDHAARRADGFIQRARREEWDE